MVKIGLWIELDVGIGFLVGLGLGSLIGQRTVPIIILIALEIIVTPILAAHVDPVLPGRPAARGRHRAGPAPARRTGRRAGRRRPRPGALRRARRAGHTADAHLGDDHRDRRLDRGLVGHRRLADGHPRRMITAQRGPPGWGHRGRKAIRRGCGRRRGAGGRVRRGPVSRCRRDARSRPRCVPSAERAPCAMPGRPGKRAARSPCPGLLQPRHRCAPGPRRAWPRPRWPGSRPGRGTGASGGPRPRAARCVPLPTWVWAAGHTSATCYRGRAGAWTPGRARSMPRSAVPAPRGYPSRPRRGRRRRCGTPRPGCTSGRCAAGTAPGAGRARSTPRRRAGRRGGRPGPSGRHPG